MGNNRRSTIPILFDVDGVLIDSLYPHLCICGDKAREYGLSVAIPTVDQFRRITRSGVKVSPMLNFFLAVGFPMDIAVKSVTDYERDFMEFYRPNAFNNVDILMKRLVDEGHTLGLVTSNTRANVAPALRDVMKYFDEECIYFFDRYPVPRSKSWCIADGVRALQSKSCIYVGDQLADELAAKEAHARFLGVSYGWGISADDTGFPIATSVEDIPIKISEMEGYKQSCLSV